MGVSVSEVKKLGVRKLPDSLLGDPGLKMEYVSAERFGELFAPESLSELVLLMERCADRGRKVAAWRAQADISWGIDCTAFRRLKGSLPDENLTPANLEGTVRDYEKKLLDDARMVGHGLRDGRRLTDLELLSVLRHYGAATRLMDFTRNAFVALWFATQSNPDGYGLLVGVHPKSGNARRVRTESHLNMSLEDLLDYENMKGSCIFWEPRHLFERMRVQQSLFLFGPVIENKWGSAPFGLADEESAPLPDELLLIAVSPSLKRQLLDVDGYKASWESHFGYSEQYLFPDLEGYAGSHSSSSPIRSGFFDTSPYEGTPVGKPISPDDGQ